VELILKEILSTMVSNYLLMKRFN